MRAVHPASAAFHAGITIHDCHDFTGRFEDLVRTDLNAPAAPRASVPGKPQGGDILQVPETLHIFPPYCVGISPISSRTTPARTAHPITGRAIRISFLTPERGVNGVQPVKLSA